MAVWKKTAPAQTPAAEKKEGQAALNKINQLIDEENGKIQEHYRKIGEKYVQIHAEDYEEGFSELIGSLDASQRKLSAYSMQVQFITGVIVCTSCGHSAPKGSVFCNMCGSKLPEYHFEKYEMCEACCSLVEKGTDVCPSCSHPMKPRNDHLVQCRKCGESVGKENRFCPICGDSLFPDVPGGSENTPKKEKKCPKCGSIMSPDKLFCTECGTKLN